MSIAEPPGGEPPAGELAQALGIDVDQFERRVDHLVAYAELTTTETFEPEVPGLLAVTPSSEERRFALLVDAASALREAAELALITSSSASVGDLLRRSGRLYLKASIPYGSYLVALANGVLRSDDREAYERHLANAVRAIEPTGESAPRRPGGPRRSEPREQSDAAASTAAATPQQQLYLLLAGLATRELDHPTADQLRTLMYRSRHQRSNLPVGALGIPTMRYWSAAEELMEHGWNPDGRGAQLPAVGSVLAWLSDRHADVVGSARVNDYLWRNLASPVEVVDLDLVGLAALAMRRLGVDQVMETMSRRMGRTMDRGDQGQMEFQHLQLGIRLI